MQCVCAILAFATHPALLFFPHCLINDTIFGKTALNIECLLSFSLQPLSEIILILRRIERVVFKNVEYPYSCPI